MARLGLHELDVRDEDALRHVPHYAALKQRLIDDRAVFRVLLPEDDGGYAPTWERAAFLNHTFWVADDPADVLVEAAIDADVICHVGWHHAARRALHPASAPSLEALVLGEAVASAYDLYVVGVLLRAGVASSFLDTQVPQMTEAAVAAGLPAGAFRGLLASVGADPAAAFEELRSLLFDVTTALVRCADVDAATDVFTAHADHRMAPLLHHFELSTWVMTAWRSADRGADPEPALAVDRALREASEPVAWLATAWLGRA